MSSLRPCLVATLMVALGLPAVAHARHQAPAAEPSTSPAATPVTATVAPPVDPATVPSATVTPAGDPWPTAPSAATAVAAVPAASPPPPPRPLPGQPVKITEGNDRIAAGLAVFGGFYFFTSLAGAVIVDKARDRKTDNYTGEREPIDTRRVNHGRALFVPVAGPFIALAFTDSAKQRWGAVLSGTAQATGIIVAAVGMLRKARVRRAQRYSVGGGAAASGAMVSLSGRF